MRTYGRDDVFSALSLQKEVRKQILDGWRPVRAMRRGALPPMKEPVVVLNREETTLEGQLPQEETGEEGSGSEEGVSQASTDEAERWPEDKGLDEVAAPRLEYFLINMVTGKFHVAMAVNN